MRFRMRSGMKAACAAGALLLALAGAPLAAESGGMALPNPGDFQSKTKTTMTEASIGDLMGQGDSCMEFSWRPVPALQGVCCYNFQPCPRDSSGNYLPSCAPTRCWGNKKGWAYDIGYWEPSAVIEVSCRQGYSMLKPGLSGRSDKSIQSCTGFNKPGNSRWFFEARVWAINGYDGGLRHQAMGPIKGEQMRQCSEKGDDTRKGDVWGYGRKKWNGFSRGAANGPGGSWEAYISDNDPAWATDAGGASAVPNQKPCNIGSVDLENCWGPVNETGWVSHPNPRVAAALAAWRAHTVARNRGKVSPPAGGGYKMMMDYPFLKHSGDYGQSMGMPGGGRTGSKCFQPGDSGPEWFGGMKPTEIPGFVKGLKGGDLTAVSDVNSGVYIFTIWVKTSCMRWKVQTPGPAGMCQYEDKS